MNAPVITVNRIANADLALPTNTKWQLVGTGRSFAPETLVLHKQAVLTLTYRAEDLDTDGNDIADVDVSTMKILYFDGTDWQAGRVPTVWMKFARTVTVRVNHLGLYVLAADSMALPTETKVFLTKNPFNYGAQAYQLCVMICLRLGK